MSKRTQLSIITREVEIFQYFHKESGLQQTEVGKILNLSGRTINAYLMGRADIPIDRRESLLMVYERTVEEFEELLNGSKELPVNLTSACKKRIDQIPEEKLKFIYSLLKSMSRKSQAK